MLKNALKTEKEITLLVDSNIAFNNCATYAKSKGCFVNTIGADNYQMHILAPK